MEKYALLGIIEQDDSRPNVEILKFSDNIEELKEIRELFFNFKTGQEEDLTKEEVENNNKIIQKLSKFEEIMPLQDEMTGYYVDVIPMKIIKIVEEYY